MGLLRAGERKAGFISGDLGWSRQQERVSVLIKEAIVNTLRLMAPALFVDSDRLTPWDRRRCAAVFMARSQCKYGCFPWDLFAGSLVRFDVNSYLCGKLWLVSGFGDPDTRLRQSG